MTPQEIAERSAQVMWDNDVSSKHIGMRITSMGPGTAVLEMPVAEYMINGQDVCHGGYIFMLSDSAFAFACNSHNVATLAQGCSVDFVRPAFAGDLLTASATEISRGKTIGIYDIEVRNQNDKIVGVTRGKSFALGKPLFTNE